MRNILIIDTKAGNLFSLKAAIERLGYSATILQQPNDQKYDGVVIPGQGRFGTVMKNVLKNQWQTYLENSFKNSVPMLGICVGMQIFFESSAEDPGVEGFAWFNGRAEALDFPKKPMVGWAKLASKIDLWHESIVYFVNSYAIKQSDHNIAETSYGETFCAAIRKGSFTGVQFHPEKSGTIGSQLIEAALKMERSND